MRADVSLPGIDAVSRHGDVSRFADRPAGAAAELPRTDRGLPARLAARLPGPEYRLRAAAHRHATECGDVELPGASAKEIAIELGAMKKSRAEKRGGDVVCGIGFRSCHAHAEKVTGSESYPTEL